MRFDWSFPIDLLRNIFLHASSDVYLGWVAYYLTVAVIVSLVAQRRARMPLSLAKALRFCFPRATLWTRSAFVDYQFTILNTLVTVDIFLSRDALLDFLTRVTNPLIEPLPTLVHASGGVPTLVVFSFSVLVVSDLVVTLTHYLFHKIPILWGFHKVHHSALALNIFTAGRRHPVEGFIFQMSVVFFLGLWTLACGRLFGFEPREILWLDMNVFLALRLMSTILIHSHVPVFYGPLSQVLISPAMHHVHHSAGPEHTDKNFGFFFSVWDHLLGSHHVPTTDEHAGLKYGLGPSEPRPMTTFLENLLLPFVPPLFSRRLAPAPDPRPEK